MKYSLFFLCISFFGFSQQTKHVDFKTAKAFISFKDRKQEVKGVITYEFEILNDIDSVFVDAINFKNIHYILDNQFSDSLYNGNKLIIKHPFKAKSTHKIDIFWNTIPKKAMYFIGWDFNQEKKQIWTQGQGKYTSNWLPSLDDMNDKIEFDLSITFDSNYQVIANGKLTSKKQNKVTTTWHYNMKKPMSSYLVALAIGKYHKKIAYSKSGIPLEMYYYPEDSTKFETTYRYTKQLFDFFEAEIGVPYPWQNYKQIPVKDFLYAGMENTGTTIFSDSFVVDSIAFIDKNYVNVNAHELAHQWFGNLVTQVSSTHHWLHEGFATYYALLAEKEVFGNDYFYERLYEYAQELNEQEKAGLSTSLLNPKSSSITFYKKGAWVLHMLYKEVGHKAFKNAVKNFLKNHQFKNVNTHNFIVEVEKASGKDLSSFVKIWLENTTFLYEKCITVLQEDSKVISEIVNLEQALQNSHESFAFNWNRNFDENRSSKIQAYLFSKNNIKMVPDSIIIKGLKSNNIKVRQAIAKSLVLIPSELKEDYEMLLDNKSYITIESALFNLWQSFPEDQAKYLKKTKGIVGFNDKNIRILWLTLALMTDGFEIESKEQYFDELISYTNPIYSFEIRQNAFQYLSYIQACNDICKEHLKQATTHHSWQFSKFAKELLKSIH